MTIWSKSYVSQQGSNVWVVVHENKYGDTWKLTDFNSIYKSIIGDIYLHSTRTVSISFMEKNCNGVLNATNWGERSAFCYGLWIVCFLYWIHHEELRENRPCLVLHHHHYCTLTILFQVLFFFYQIILENRIYFYR